MFDKKRAKKLILILLIAAFLICGIWALIKSQASYQTLAKANGDLDVAMYLLKEDYQNVTLNLQDLQPREEPYVYNFLVSNSDGKKRSEVDLEYDLTITTTTNLPLEYELTMESDYQTVNTTTAILRDFIYQDEYDTFFRKITTEKQSFKFSENQSNLYTLKVYFPESYKHIKYQDIIELVEIAVDSKQIIEE